MSISKEELIRLIKEEIENVSRGVETGKTMSAGAYREKGIQQTKDVSASADVSNNEQAIMSQVAELMLQYSKNTDDKLKSGPIYALLNRAAQQMKKELSAIQNNKVQKR